MSEVVQTARPDFWRSPLLSNLPSALPAMPEECHACGSEFMVGSLFCHTCGAGRVRRSPSPIAALGNLGFLRAMEFQNIKRQLGLPLPALISFLLGIGCVLATILVGVIYSAHNFADFQAIQSWRMEWLLAAVAAFVAGILLKKPVSSEVATFGSPSHNRDSENSAI